MSETTNGRGNRLAYLIAAAGWSQIEFARRAGLTPQRVSDYCRGRHLPSPRRALVICRLLSQELGVIWPDGEFDFLEKSFHKSFP